jgi:Xaa-Pro aminopeptidase
MDAFTSGPLRIDPDETMTAPPPQANGAAGPGPVAPRRADVDAKQAQVAEVLREIDCEAILLVVPANVTWFTAGMNVRGLIAESERPAVYVNTTQRWVICSNIDTHRLFDEELDQLGFQLKEWSWDGGRADLLANVVAGRKVACDRPLANLPIAGERLRHLLRVLSPLEQRSYRDLGKLLAHAIEATGRNINQGQTEEEVAGQLGHRLLHHGAEPTAISITADGRGAKFRRSGFTSAALEHTCTIQATAQRDGLFVTASRTVSFGPPPAEFRTEYDFAWRLAAVCRLFTRPEETVGTAGLAGRPMLVGTPYEFDWRLSQPGYGAGRFPAEELRRAGQDEPFMAGQAIVWQPRVGAAAAVDTVLVTDDGPVLLTPFEDWPVRRANVRGELFDIPDILVRTDG